VDTRDLEAEVNSEAFDFLREACLFGTTHFVVAHFDVTNLFGTNFTKLIFFFCFFLFSILLIYKKKFFRLTFFFQNQSKIFYF